jgi:phosphoglycerol transferase MdoB-like AlkP superfamily enzyme
MRQRLKILAYVCIFWITFQVCIRAIFLLYNHDLSAQLTAGDIFNVFLHGLKMDASMSGYFLMLTGLILTISVFIQSRWIPFILNTITITIIILSSIIVIVDIELYRHWGFRLDTTPLFYMSGAESEAMGSVGVSVVIKLFFILLTLATTSIFVYSVWIAPQLTSLRPAAKKKSAIVLLIITGLLFIPVRGSFSVAPMNTGFVYFHNSKTYANHAAINAVWNFFYSLQKSGESEYPENFFDKAEAEKYFHMLYANDDSTVHVFTEPKPNIILFILESFTSNIIEPLGGVKGLTPNFNQLCAEGVLFDNFYCSGDRTDKGIISILSGYPSQPNSNIIKYPAKTQKLPMFNHFMREQGYHTSFVYGGDIDFANFRSYFTTSSFDHITTDEDFPDEYNESKWGVHDHIVFQRALEECDSSKKPFFKVILSLSSHEPFDVPMTPYIKEKDPESLFLNACHYTDKCIGDFVNKAKNAPWWKNTVIVFVADHGHRHPGGTVLESVERHKIPLLMTGGAIKKDTVIHTIGNQTDIANTLLAQIDRPRDEFKFSKNMLSPSARSFAAYFFTNGYGFITPDAYIIYDNTGREFHRKDGATEDDLNMSKAYQQILYLDYNSK